MALLKNDFIENSDLLNSFESKITCINKDVTVKYSSTCIGLQKIKMYEDSIVYNMI